MILHHKPSREGGRLTCLLTASSGDTIREAMVSGWNVFQADSCMAAQVCRETRAGLGVPPTVLQLLQGLLVHLKKGWGCLQVLLLPIVVHPCADALGLALLAFMELTSLSAP